jgi:uncharacterized FlaG/YvyC family protein
MEKIKRPIEVPKAQASYLTNEKYQEYVNEQLQVIYDKIDEIISYINTNP